MAESQNNQAGAGATGKTKLQLAREAQEEQNTAIAQQRIALLQSLRDLKAIGGKDDIAGSIVAIVNAFPGILFSELTEIIPSAEAKIRKSLVSDGLITETKTGLTWQLNPGSSAHQSKIIASSLQ